MQPLGRDGYSREAIIAALHAPHRDVRFTYDVLDEANERIGELSTVESATVENNSLATNVKRTAKLKTGETSDINFLSDRIRPWFVLKMPDGGEASWPLGIFLPITPSRSVTRFGQVRDVEAYDQLLVLLDDKVEDRYVVAAGTNYVTAVETLLASAGIVDYSIISTDKTLPSTRDWSPGTEKLRIINELLRAVNYSPLYFNSEGRAIGKQYQRPSDRGSGYEYAADERSILVPELSAELDLFGVANKWIATVSEANRPPLTATYTNAELTSPTSVPRRGRTIVDFRKVDAADQESLDAYVQRIAFEASQVYEIIEVETALMPHHENDEIVRVTYPDASIGAKYSEHTWSLPLKAGAKMKHKLRRVVTI